jgi:hypothetical protein
VLQGSTNFFWQVVQKQTTSFGAGFSSFLVAATTIQLQSTMVNLANQTPSFAKVGLYVPTLKEVIDYGSYMQLRSTTSAAAF